MKKNYIAGLGIFLAGILFGVALTSISASFTPPKKSPFVATEQPQPAERMESPPLLIKASPKVAAETTEPKPQVEEIFDGLSEEEISAFEDNILSLVARAKKGDAEAFEEFFKELGITKDKPGYDVYWAEKLYDEIKTVKPSLTFPKEPELHKQLTHHALKGGWASMKPSIYSAYEREYRAAKADFGRLIKKKNLSPEQEAILWEGVEVADAYFQLKSEKERVHRNDWIIPPERKKYFERLTKVADGFTPKFDREWKLARQEVTALQATYNFGFPEYNGLDNYLEGLVDSPCRKAWEKHRLYFANSCMVLSHHVTTNWTQWIDEDRIQEITGEDSTFVCLDGFAILPMVHVERDPKFHPKMRPGR